MHRAPRTSLMARSLPVRSKTLSMARLPITYPQFMVGGELTGVKLTFKDGRVVEASADKGEDYLFSQLDMDEGARTMGEFAIGTNEGLKTFTGEILFDEKMGRTIHTAIGLGIERAGGVNKSDVHWDMVHRMDNSEIYVDDELFYKNGEFVVDVG